MSEPSQEEIHKLYRGARKAAELEHCSDAEFELEMEKVNNLLQEKNIPIFARELRAVGELCMTYGFPLGLDEPLAKRICNWFRAKYGSKMSIDLCSYSPVLIRGDAYKMTIPPLFAGGFVVAIAPPTPEIPGRPVVNVVDQIDALPNAVIQSLRTSELLYLQTTFMGNAKQFRSVNRVISAQNYRSAFGDLAAACNHVTQARFELGLSRWHSLQFLEKVLKGWIASRGQKFTYTHKLNDLAKCAASHGLLPIREEMIDLVQCDAGVRYDASGLTVSGAVTAFHTALEIATSIIDDEMSRHKPGVRK